jgi:hypothetical protein
VSLLCPHYVPTLYYSQLDAQNAGIVKGRSARAEAAKMIGSNPLVAARSDAAGAAETQRAESGPSDPGRTLVVLPSSTPDDAV